MRSTSPTYIKRNTASAQFKERSSYNHQSSPDSAPVHMRTQRNCHCSEQIPIFSNQSTKPPQLGDSNRQLDSPVEFQAAAWDGCAEYTPHLASLASLAKYYQLAVSPLQRSLDFAELLSHCAWYRYEESQSDCAFEVFHSVSANLVSTTAVHPVKRLPVAEIESGYGTDTDRSDMYSSYP